MKKEDFFSTASIIIAVVSVYLFQSTFLSSYSSYMLALLVIFFAIYISIKKRSKSASELFTGSSPEIFGIISITLLIILLTGSLASPLFFFLYFILFLLAFMSTATSVWVFLISLILYFMPEVLSKFDSDTFIKIGSLLLIAPIAYFIAKEFERRQVLSRRIESKTEEIISDAQVLKESSNRSDPAENEAIDEIIEEAESLKEDSKN